MKPPVQFAGHRVVGDHMGPSNREADRQHAMAMFENIRADFEAHGRNIGAQGFWVMIVYRFGRWRYSVRPALLRKLCSFCLLYTSDAADE